MMDGCRRYLAIISLLLAPSSMFAQQQSITLDSLINQLNQSTQYHISLGNRVSGKEAIPLFSSQTTSIQDILKDCGLDFKTIDSNIVITQLRQYYISGFVRDAVTDDGLVGAHVYTEDGVGTTTDDFGYFQLQVPQGQLVLTSSYLGYKRSREEFQVASDQRASFTLTSDFSLPGVTVSSDWAEDARYRTTRLDLNHLAALPSLETTVDLGRYLQFQSGITAGADGLGGLHVRGGSADQNLYLVDGIPIFNPFHLLGIASLFNTSVVKHAQFHKGGFSSRHGGRLSSVLEVTLNSGNKSDLGGSAGLSRSNLQAMLEGPIGKESTFMVAGTLTTPGNFIGNGLSMGLGGADIDLCYGDIFGKISLQLGAKDQVQMTLYHGRNQLQERDTFWYEDDEDLLTQVQNDRYRWGNTAGSLRWQRSFSPSLYGRMTLLHSQFTYESISLLQTSDANAVEGERIDFRSTTRQSAIQLHFDKVISPSAGLNFGTAFSLNHYTPGVVAYLNAAESNPIDDDFRSLRRQGLFDDSYNYTSSEWNSYIEYNQDLGSLWHVQAGLRSSVYWQANAALIGIRPRFRLRRTISQISTIELSFGQLQQTQHVISTLDNAYPNELYVPATAEHPAQVSSVVDLQYGIQLKNFRLTAGGFYKRMHGLLAFTPNPDFLTPARLDNVDASAWQDDVIVGDGHAYGFEWSTQFQSPIHQIQLTYTYARSWRFFDDLYAGYEIPYIFDRPHSLNILGTTKLGKSWQLGYAWQFGSGTTLPLTDGYFEVYDVFDELAASFDVPENDVSLYLYEPYHRLDLSLGFSAFGESISHHAKIAITNVYDRLNPANATIWYYDVDREVQTQAGLPRMLQFSYLVRF